MADLAEKLSSLVQYQLPDFVRDNYDTFQAFLVAYYEFTEQNTEVQYAIQNSESYKDIDTTIDAFVDNFLEQYAYDLPKSVFLDQQFKTASTSNTIESKRAFAKRLMKYYGSKGSEAGINLLFRLLFNETPTIYYPKEDLFKPSSGLWKVRETIKILDIANVGTFANTLGGVIAGETSLASAVIDDIFFVGFSANTTPQKIYEIQLEPDSLSGTFQVNERALFKVGNLTSGNLETVSTANILGLISNIEIVDSGIGYTAGDGITITTSNSTSYVGSVGSVSDTGQIKTISTLNFGYGYDADETPTVVISGGGTKYTGKYEVSSNVATVVLTDATGNAIPHGLSKGEVINVNFVTGLTGANGLANVGTILSSVKFTLSNSNVYASASGNLQLQSNAAVITASVGAVATYDGAYSNKDGHVSDIKKIQDSNYYQEYSYVIRATQSSQYWKDIVKQALHPAGLKLFSEAYVSVETGIDAVYAGPVSPIYQTLLRFLRIISTAALQPVLPINTIRLSSTSSPSRGIGRTRIGPTYKTLETFKYDYDNLHIYDVGNVTLEFLAGNLNTPFYLAPPNEVFRGNINLINNSTFSAGTNWNLGSGFSIGSGNLQASAATSNTFQSFTTAGNVRVMATFEIKSRSAGSVALASNTFVGTSRDSVGNYSEIFFVNSPTSNIIISATGFTGDIDNVYVKVLEPVIY